MKKQKLWLPILLSAVCCAGCGIFSAPGYTETADYDLRTSEKNMMTPALPVRFGVFSNLSGAGTRMLERDKDGKILLDEYNRWLLPPEQLLRRGMTELFLIASDREAKVQIYCQLLRFETDGGKAILEAEYLLRSAEKEQLVLHRFETQLKGSGGSAVAAAMSENMLKSARKLNQDVTAFATRIQQKENKK